MKTVNIFSEQDKMEKTAQVKAVIQDFNNPEKLRVVLNKKLFKLSSARKFKIFAKLLSLKLDQKSKDKSPNPVIKHFVAAIYDKRRLNAADGIDVFESILRDLKNQQSALFIECVNLFSPDKPETISLVADGAIFIINQLSWLLDSSEEEKKEFGELVEKLLLKNEGIESGDPEEENGYTLVGVNLSEQTLSWLNNTPASPAREAMRAGTSVVETTSLEVVSVEMTEDEKRMRSYFNTDEEYENWRKIPVMH